MMIRLLSCLLLLVALCAVVVQTAPTYDSSYDVIIVGGGLSGLSTAKRLIEAGKHVLVLEARDRTGGRVHNVEWPNNVGYTEVGAEFIGPTQDKVIELVAELGLELFPEYNEGKNVYFRRGHRKLYASDTIFGAIPSEDPVTLLQLLALENDLDNMAKKIDIQNPWNSTNAAKYDSQTFQQWLNKRLLTSGAQFLAETATESIFSVSASELSFLYTLTYIAASGNETTPGTFENLISTARGAQMYKVDGGTGLIPTRLAAKLGGDKVIKLSSPVRTIQNRNETFTVTTRDETAFQATHVVVAMSPPLAGQIQYDPSLPASRAQLTQHMPMGSIGKAIALYDTPFWRDDGLSGQVISDAGLGRVTFDNSDKSASYGAMMAFMEADQMRAYDGKSESEIIAQVSKDFVNYFGEKAQQVKSWIVQRWDLEEFSQGGPVAVAGPNVYTQYGPALKQRVGNLHFAGTESSDYSIGYMDGAIRSGYRAAAEILGS